MASSIPIIYYITTLLKKIIGQRPTERIFSKIVGRKKFFYIEKVYSKETGLPTERLVVMLPTKGCEWAKVSGGCTICGFKKALEEINSSQYSGNDIVTLFKIALSLNKNDIREVSIFNGGSFLNEKELDSDAQLKICQIFAKTKAQR